MPKQDNLTNFLRITTPLISSNPGQQLPKISQLFGALSYAAVFGTKFTFTEDFKDPLNSSDFLIYAPQISVVNLFFKRNAEISMKAFPKPQIRNCLNI